jgi:hypothetical protein
MLFFSLHSKAAYQAWCDGIGEIKMSLHIHDANPKLQTSNEEHYNAYVPNNPNIIPILLLSSPIPSDARNSSPPLPILRPNVHLTNQLHNDAVAYDQRSVHVTLRQARDCRRSVFADVQCAWGQGACSLFEGCQRCTVDPDANPRM